MNMKQLQVLPSVSHGVMDYLTGAALLAAPKLLGFDHGSNPAMKTARLFGALILGQAVMTDYKLGLFKVLPFRMHLMLDYVLGPAMALAPFLFGFNKRHNKASWLTHVVAGLTGIVTTVLTRMPPAGMREIMREEGVLESQYGYGSPQWERVRRMPARPGTE